MNLLKTHAKQTLLFIFLLMTTILTQANDDFDAQRPNGIGDKKWNTLKSVVQETKLLPEPKGLGGEGSHFGSSVSVDGNRALVGTSNMAGAGAAVVLEFDGINWHEVEVLQPSDGATNDGFGFSVSLSGNRALVGAYMDDDDGRESGSAYIYDYDGASWVQSAKLTASDGGAKDYFGISVSLFGNRALVGSYLDDDNGIQSGSAYIYDYDGVSWVQSAKLTAADGGSDDYFGKSVSLYGDRALVGAYRDDDKGYKSGSAYIYNYDGASWVQSVKLTAGDGAENDYFGISVSLFGDRALVGAFGDDDNGNESGSAYIFDYNGVSWVQSAKLTAADGAANDDFGISVSLSVNRALVGAYFDDDKGNESGSAYIYDYDGVSWSQSAKLTAGDGAVEDYFGFSVNLSVNRALVGAYGDDDNGGESGSAYIYDYDGESWVQSTKLTASDGSAYDRFGISVSLSGKRTLVGAMGDNDNGSNSGSAYIFNDDFIYKNSFE